MGKELWKKSAVGRWRVAPDLLLIARAKISKLERVP
jgi:hypothetical protein